MHVGINYLHKDASLIRRRLIGSLWWNKSKKSPEEAQQMGRLRRQLQDEFYELSQLFSEIEKAEVFSEVLSWHEFCFVSTFWQTCIFKLYLFKNISKSSFFLLQERLGLEEMSELHEATSPGDIKEMKWLIRTLLYNLIIVAYLFGRFFKIRFHAHFHEILKYFCCILCCLPNKQFFILLVSSVNLSCSIILSYRVVLYFV